MSITKPGKTVTATEWADAGLHNPLLPSGSRVGIRIPDLPLLVETGEIPDNLLDAALGVVADNTQTPSRELVVRQREFTDLLVKKTVVEPDISKYTDDQMRTIPFEDKELIVAFATRQRDVDAEGAHLAGLEVSEKFRKFRGIGEFDSPLADL